MSHSDTQNDLLAAALVYAQLGCAVFPCRVRSKQPATAHGFKEATTDPKQIHAWWTQNPQYNVAIATGAVSNLLVIDVDPRNGGDIDAFQHAHGKLPETPTVITGGGGRQYYLSHPGGHIPCNSGKLAAGIDIKADGGYVIAPPSVHPNGSCYAWDSQADIADVGNGACPAWLIDLLANFSENCEHGRTSCLPVRRTQTGETAANVIAPGQRNSALASLAGGMRRMGMGQVEINAALQAINRQRCQPPLSDAEVDKIADSISRYEPDAVSVALVENHYSQMFEDNDKQENKNTPQAPGPFPGELIERTPDIVKRVMDYYQNCAVEVQPVLMLASLIAATGVVLGHKVRDVSGLRTNIYVLGVTASGGGKEATREVIRKIFQYADIEAMCGPEDFASDAGLIAIVEKQNPILFQLDEFGRLMQCVNAGPLKNPHLYNVGSVLLKFYGKAGSVFRSKAYAEVKRNRIIRNPHVCLYATTVKSNFWKAMDVDSLEGGFLPRLLIFADDHDPQSGGSLECEPPAEVVEFFAGWAQRRNTSGNLEQAGTSTIHPHPMLVTCTPDARAIMNEFKVRQKTQQKQHDDLGVLWSRARENAGKLALIYAAWKNSLEVIVDAEAAQWAVAVVDHVVRHTVYEAHLCISEGPFHQRCQKILRALEQSSPGHPLTKRQLCRKTQSMTPRERSEAVQALLEQGLIGMQMEETATKPKTLFWKEYQEKS